MAGIVLSSTRSVPACGASRVKARPHKAVGVDEIVTFLGLHPEHRPQQQHDTGLPVFGDSQGYLINEVERRCG